MRPVLSTERVVGEPGRHRETLWGWGSGWERETGMGRGLLIFVFLLVLGSGTARPAGSADLLGAASPLPGDVSAWEPGLLLHRKTSSWLDPQSCTLGSACLDTRSAQPHRAGQHQVHLCHISHLSLGFYHQHWYHHSTAHYCGVGAAKLTCWDVRCVASTPVTGPSPRPFCCVYRERAHSVAKAGLEPPKCQN